MEETKMFKNIFITASICVLILGAVSIQAQKSTEMFIPMGQSPGLSGEYTVMGRIDQVNAGNQTIQMSGPSGSYTVKLTQNTFIYLDRSNAQLPNRHGTLADCQAGDTVEVKFVNNSRTEPIEWIKVQKAE
jgi:hypothetical protein